MKHSKEEYKRCIICGELKEKKEFQPSVWKFPDKSVKCRKCNNNIAKLAKRNKGRTYCGLKNDITGFDS